MLLRERVTDSCNAVAPDTVIRVTQSVPRSEQCVINHLTPNDHYMGRTAQLTSRRSILYIQQIYVLNILNTLHDLRFFSLQNAVYFIMLPFLVPVLFTF